ncbi:endonuclease/exonuclease/phosphatase family protein [Asticcacaulis sp.]|uniref:endonuclease/exonuclease/phosphatase family protein n=1 Tax=Asticcacaulis sp. TaxID=1872648 RepID=UPI00391AF84B
MKRATLLLSFVCIVALASFWMATELSWIAAASLLFWHYAALALLVAGICAAFVFKAWRKPVLVACVAVFVSYAAPLASDALNNPPRKDRANYKAISYNWLFSGTDRSAFYAWLTHEDPDILSIQEFNKKDLAPLLASQPRSYFVSETRDDIVILSRYPLSEEKMDKVFTTRLVSVTAALPTGKLRVFGVHAPTLRDVALLSQRNSYLAKIPDLLGASEAPRLVMGDFNSTAWEPLIARLKARARLHEAPRLIPLPTRMAVRRHLDIGSPIDHVMVSPSVHLGPCRTGPLMTSDHRPLICEFSI